MPTISNKTQKPLSVPLSGGKKLHLPPGKTGQVTAKAVEGAAVQKLIEAGELEILDGDKGPSSGPGASKKTRNTAQSHSAGGAMRRSGDR